MRLQILKPYNPENESPVTWKELGQVLNRLNWDSARMLNYVIQAEHLLMAEYQQYKATATNPMTFKEFREQKGKNIIYNQLRSKYPHIAPCNLAASEQFAKNFWQRYRKSLKTMDMSIPSFNKNAPIIIRAADYNIMFTDNNFIIDAPLLASTEPRNRYSFILKSGDNSKAAILFRLVSNEYKKGNMQIIKKKDKWFCLLPYSFEAQSQGLDKTKILGVDMGVSNAVYWAVSGSLKRGYIPGGEIEEFRKRIRARRISIQNQGRHSGESRNGHGRKRKLAPISALAEKEQNFRETINHRYAKTIVNTAIKNNCGTIQLEDLSEISTDNKFLKNWPYYDLRTKIEYKAKEHGIFVIIVDPQYTSQRCSECGHISAENRDHNKFECSACGYGRRYICKDCGHIQLSKQCKKCGGTNTYKQFVHADYNAARNLTIPDIDKVIEAELKQKVANP